jgi:hypothetical protein
LDQGHKTDLSQKNGDRYRPIALHRYKSVYEIRPEYGAEFLEALGIAEQVPRWEEAAKEAAHSLRSPATVAR